MKYDGEGKPYYLKKPTLDFCTDDKGNKMDWCTQIALHISSEGFASVNEVFAWPIELVMDTYEYIVATSDYKGVMEEMNKL